MSKTTDRFSGFVYLFIIGCLVYAYATNIVSAPLPASHCDNVSGTSVGAYGLNYKAAGTEDITCKYLEHARLDPREARSELMRCSTGASIRAFGGGVDAIKRCLDYNGDSDEVIAKLKQQINTCKARSKKLRYRLTLRKNKKFNQCMSSL